METRHLHLMLQCRNHPNEQELVPDNDLRGVFETTEQAESRIDDFVSAAPDESCIDHRGPGVLLFHTMDAGNKKDIEFGGDGKCHKILTIVTCIGDPEGCAVAIMNAAKGDLIMDMLNDLMRSLSDGPSDGPASLDELFGNLLGDHKGPHVHDDGTPMLGFGRPAPEGFATGPVNEPIRGWDDDPFADFDFGGFDEPTDPKRLN